MISVDTDHMEKEDIVALKEFLVEKGFDFKDYGLQSKKE